MKMELLAPVQEACELAFEVYAKGSLVLEWESLPKLWRAVGENPTQKRIDELIAKYRKDDAECFTKEEWISLCEYEQPDDSFKEDTLIEAFRQFDKDGSGVISVNMLRYLNFGN